MTSSSNRRRLPIRRHRTIDKFSSLFPQQQQWQQQFKKLEARCSRLKKSLKFSKTIRSWWIFSSISNPFQNRKESMGRRSLLFLLQWFSAHCNPFYLDLYSTRVVMPERIWLKIRYSWLIFCSNQPFDVIRVVMLELIWLKIRYSWLIFLRTDCDAPCFEQLKATHLRASPKQQALLDVLLQLIKAWPLTISPWYNLI